MIFTIMNHYFRQIHQGYSPGHLTLTRIFPQAARTESSWREWWRGDTEHGRATGYAPKTWDDFLGPPKGQVGIIVGLATSYYVYTVLWSQLFSESDFSWLLWLFHVSYQKYLWLWILHHGFHGLLRFSYHPLALRDAKDGDRAPYEMPKIQQLRCFLLSHAFVSYINHPSWWRNPWEMGNHGKPIKHGRDLMISHDFFEISHGTQKSEWGRSGNKERMATSVWDWSEVLVGGLEHQFYVPIQLGMSSSQLTNSYFSEGWPKTTNQSRSRSWKWKRE